ncbi:hypothetical protein LCGC14_0275510 [marine sediment metagenome]|uniref:O-methyltransferase domain-containing protein n=1 Tax=marine sediment metagenome TaxID=412755 RepID=A0A0F9WIF7_9ZZZZ
MTGPLPTLRIPSLFVAEIQKRLHLCMFIDTGTWEGLTAIWAAQHFDRVHTIEIDEARFHAACGKIMGLGLHDTIVTHLGDSREVLEKIIPFVDSTTFFWLGARTEDDCPLMEELALIRGGSDSHFIMIDDMERFRKGVYPTWPTFDEICAVLKGLAFFLEGDVLTAFPHEYTQVVMSVIQKARKEKL